jgi:hypothetical protein
MERSMTPGTWAVLSTETRNDPDPKLLTRA